MKHVWLTTLCILLLLGSPIFGGAKEEDGKYVKAGAKLVLNKSVSVPANQAHVRFQGGEIKERHDQYYPNCRLETRAKKSAPQTIEADTFVVTKTLDLQEDASGVNIINYATRISLKSDKQPDVFQMICQQWDDRGEFAYPTMEQIRIALGDFFRIEPGQ